MSLVRLATISVAYHWRCHVAVALSVAVGVAVLVGALAVGDSMRASLRRLTLARLGRIDDVLVGNGLFRESVADAWSEALGAQGRPADAAPILIAPATLESTGSPPVRANRVQVIGCDQRFWTLGEGAPRQLPDDRQIVLNRPLADHLGVGPGDWLIVRMSPLGSVPAESPLGRRTETLRSERVEVVDVIEADGLGRFGLHPSQQTPRNAFVPLSWLARRLEQPGRAGAVLLARRDEKPTSAANANADADPQFDALARSALRPNAADCGLRFRDEPGGYVDVTSERLLLEPAAERALQDARLGGRIQPALTYLANALECGTRSIPYSTVTAMDFAMEPPLGPMRDLEGRPVAPLADDRIALNAWAADDLDAKPGDTIRMTYFEPESTHGQVVQRSVALRLAAVLKLEGPAADRALTPDVPGVTDQRSIADWNPPFPFDAHRIRPKDDRYWRDHRGTPKAFVSLATGRKLWAGRFGQTTSLRIAGAGVAAAVAAKASLPPEALGLVVQPVRQQGLDASSGTVPFEALFLGCSMFLVAAALMLVAITFRLAVEGRAAETGLLAAVGFCRGRIARWVALEAALVASVGSVLGVALGAGYAWLLVTGLRTWWLGAIGTPFLTLSVTIADAVLGIAAGLLAGVGVAVATVRWLTTIPARRLLVGVRGAPPARTQTRNARLAARSLFAAAAIVAGASWGLDVRWRAAAFFGAGVLLLAGGCAETWSRLAIGATGPAVALGGGNLVRLALRSAARHPLRSTLGVGLVASAAFLIASMSAFRIDPESAPPTRDDGSGGFSLVAETDQPVYHNPGAAVGQAALGIGPQESALLGLAKFFPLRVRSGDDASCLNLYRPRQPRMLGVGPELIARGGFAWAGFDRAGEAPLRQPDEPLNPWRLLDAPLPHDADGVDCVPIVLEQNTAVYSLHLSGRVGETLDVADAGGRPVRLQIVGLLDPSLFQGFLLMSEASLLRHFPENAGYRMFLVETSPDEIQSTARELESAFSDFGMTVQTGPQRLAAFAAVQNTYLSTFQGLGALGLLLGTLGLAAVQLRSVLERRRELALLGAIGFARRRLAAMIALETGVMLTAGLAWGLAAAVVAVAPHALHHAASVPWLWLAGTFSAVLVVGLAAGWFAVRAAMASPLVASLRSE